MHKKFLILLSFLFCIFLHSFAEVHSKYYLDGYSPLVYNKIDYYKVYKGLNFIKTRPYLISSFGTISSTKIILDSLEVIVSTKVGDITIYPDVSLSFERYLDGVKSKVFHQTLINEALTIQQQAGGQTSGLIKDITIDLPNIAIPRTIRRILGSKAGRLNLDGTQRITISGTSTKRKIVPVYDTSSGSRFDLKMQQDTDLRLTGTIGEKIAVNLNYNSNQDETLFNPNNINIKYTGDEDEVVQVIEAGNIALSLSGSRYISYSTSSQGLFGIISKLKFGPLDLTMIASKEEGQKNTMSYLGQSQADSTIIYSKNFAPRTFYFLENPYDIYDLYTSTDESIPEGWVNNAIVTNNIGEWNIRYPSLLPKNGSVHVYIDDGDATNNVAAAPGDSVFVSETEYYLPFYDELIEGTDFVTNYSLGTIEILKNVDRLHTVAVQYIRIDDTPVPSDTNVQDGLLKVKVIRTKNQEYDPTNPYSTWNYQMRNIYSMGITNIKKDDFLLEIYTENPDRTRNYDVPDSLSSSDIVKYNDYLKLDSNGDGRVNGDDNTVNLTSGYVIIPVLRPFYPLGDTLIYQEESENVSYNDFIHFISVKGKIGRDVITLGQTGVLTGSVKVKVNGSTQKENIDYLVDYDLGQITFLTAAGKDPDAKIEIDYEYRSGFAVAKKTLAGIRADWNLTEDAKIGGTFIYRSETVEDKRPKIGNENIQLILADVDGSITWKPGFITRWIDALPLIKTSAESSIGISGEVAVTMPNISGDSQNPNQAYLDDMEGILDSYPLGLSSSTWVMGSKPYQTSLPQARVNWYNPNRITMQNVFDSSTLNANELNESVTVLAMKIVPNTIQQPDVFGWNYAGIMKYLGNQLDFSNKKYIELLVKVDKYGEGEPPPNITLHVDLGDVNEDFYTTYGGLNFLNSEDANNDGELSANEDTGLDGITDGEPGDDPNDTATIDNPDADGDYKNGSERNGLLDTEDLDSNGVLNQLDRYLSYSVALSDTIPSQNPYLIEYNRNNYLLLRIPLNQSSAYNIVNNSSSGILPTLKKISYVRVWAETDKTARIILASASLVGNKWEDFYIRNLNNSIISSTALNTNNETYISGIADNQKTSHYVSPQKTYYTELDKPTLEQSLTLKTEFLQPGHRVLLRQRIIDYYSLLSYGKLLFWVYPENAENTLYTENDSIDVLFRLGADSLNYYQVRQPVKIVEYRDKMQEALWSSLEFDLQDFSRIKDSLEVDLELQSGGRFFSYKGFPTLTNVREFTLGLQRNPESNSPYNGTTFFDDIRVADPYEDFGWAGRVNINSVLADFSTFDIEYEQKSENFNPNIQRGRTQSSSFSSSTSLKLSNKYFLGKFFPLSWGLRLPLSMDRNYTLSIPRYRANSDVLRSKIIDPYDKEREKSENLTYSATLGLSQTSTPKSKFLAYTINKMSLNGRISRNINNTATSRDTTLAWQATYNYNVNLPENLLAYTIYKNYKIKLIPSNYTNNFTYNYSEPHSYNWENRDTLKTWFPRTQVFPVKTLNTDNGITWALTSDFNTNYRLMTKRDFTQKSYFYNYNVGKETEYNQEIGANYTPNYFPNIMTLSNSVTSRYTENQRRYTDTVSGEQVITYLKDGNSTRTIRVNLTLMNSDLMRSLSNKIRSSSPEGTSASTKSGDDKNKTDFEEKKEPFLDYTDKELQERAKLLDEEYAEKKRKEQELSEQDQKSFEDIHVPQEKKDIQEEKNQDNDPEIKKGGKSTHNDSKASILKNIDLPYKFINAIAKIKNVAVTYQNGFSQVFTSKNRRPNYYFQLGLPNQVSADFLDSRTIEDTYTLSSGIAFSRRIDTSFDYSYALSKRFANASNQTISITFPDISLTVSDLETLLGLDRYLGSSRLNSGYQFVLRQNGDIDWITPKQETKTWSFNPLASITTNISRSVQTTLSVTTSKSDNITDMTTYDIVRKSLSQGMNGNLSYSFQSSTGIELPFTKRRINIRNELTSSLAISFEKNYDTTKGLGDAQVDRNSSRISFSPSATYQFDQNIKGGLTSSYELTTDKKRDDATRIFSLGIWVEITL